MVQNSNYAICKSVNSKDYLSAGFELKNGMYRFKKVLYRHDNTKNPYVTLYIVIEDRDMTISVMCDNGEIYVPFYNPEVRHDNLVYDKIIQNYITTMEDLVNKKILKHRKRKNNERKSKSENIKPRCETPN